MPSGKASIWGDNGRTYCDDGTRIVFVMNFKNEPVIVEDIGIWTDAETQEQYEDALQMKPFECLVLTKQKTDGN